MIELGLSFILVVVVLWFLVVPHLHSSSYVLDGAVDSFQVTAQANRLTELYDKRERYLQILRDLELDHKTGKIADQEFEKMRNPLIAELAQILKELRVSR